MSYFCDIVDKLDYLSNVIIASREPSVFDRISVVAGILSVLIIGIMNYVTIKQYRISNVSAKEQIAVAKEDASIAMQTNRFALLMRYYDLYMSLNVYNGRYSLGKMYKQRKLFAIDSSTNNNMRSACEVYHILGQIVLLGGLRLQEVESTSGEEILNSWQVIYTFRYTDNKTLLQHWREEADSKEYLSGFEYLANTLNELTQRRIWNNA